MHCHTHPMQLISHLSPWFATSQVFVFDRPLLRVTVTHPAVSEHPTERAQCVNVQSESPSFPPADSLSPASSLKCFTRSSSARHDKSSADVIRPAASDSRANRRGCVSVCVRLRACQMCKKAEKNFCKHWWLCCNSIIYLPFFVMYWIKGAVCLRHNSSENSFFFFFWFDNIENTAICENSPIFYSPPRWRRLWWHLIIRTTLFETLGNKAGRVCEHKWKRTLCSSCGFLQLFAWLGTPFFSLSL